MEVQKKWNINWLLKEATIIAIFTGWAYLVSFLFEMGFLSYFSLSPKFIVIELSSVLFSITILGAFLLSIAYSSYYFFSGEKKSFKDHEIVLATGLVFLVIFLPHILFGAINKAIPIQSALVFFIIHRWIGIYKCLGENLEKKIENFYLSQRKSNSPLDWLSDKIGRNFTVSIILLISTFYLAYSIGEATASKQEEYYIIDGKPELAVITIYGDRILAMPINLIEKTIDRKLFIINVNDLFSEREGMEITKTGKLILKN